MTRKLSHGIWMMPGMDATKPQIEFTLRPVGREEVSVRLRRLGGGWSAQISGSAASIGMGTSARSALTAALQPFGDRAIRVLLADLGLLEPSIAVLEMEDEIRSA